MRPQCRLRPSQGMTLIELCISSSIFTLILGAILALSLQGLRMYQQVAASDWATFDAATAVDQLENDIQQCFRVTGRYVNRITMTRPLLALDSQTGVYLPVEPLAAGDKVQYYLADESGVLGTQGTYLWRAIKPAGTLHYVRDIGPLADRIVTLQFGYEMMPVPRQNSVQYVNLLIKARVKEGSAIKIRGHSSRIALRNSAYGPVTTETGNDDGGE